MTCFYKLARPDGTTIHGRPMWTPGEWQHVTGKIVPGKNGLHVVTASQALQWISPNMVVWKAETDPRCRHLDDELKTIVRRARVTEPTAWKPEHSYLLAADFAEHVLPVFEQMFPDDDRPRKAIETVRQMASVFTANEDDEEVEAIRDAYVAQVAEAALDAWTSETVRASHAARAAWAAMDGRASWAADDAREARDTKAAAAEEREWQVSRMLDYFHGDAP